MKEGGNKWQCPNLRYYRGICLEGLNGALKSLNEGSQSLDLKPGSLRTQSRVLTIKIQHVQVEIQGFKKQL
jgi:hypothetical protein